MTDRELLEAAARAAGMAILPDGRWPHDAKGWFFNQVGDNPPALYNNDTPATWAPLNDDGDALRLAVKLRIDILRGKTAKGETVRVAVNGAGCFDELMGDDPCAATRRAIVRAAAALAAEPQMDAQARADWTAK